jgi:heat shock protein HslJ
MQQKSHGVIGVRMVALIILSATLMALCRVPGALAAEKPAPGPLAGTMWRLVEFQSMDDATGTTRPDNPSKYTMRLNDDGTVALRLNCNSARGSWSAEPGSDRASGRFTFGSLAATRSLCPRPSMDQLVTAQAEYVRSYLLRDGRLYLSLLADGGIFVWELTFDQGIPLEPQH